MIVGVDSSWKGAGWVIYQILKSEKRPTLYGSCTFSTTEQNYGQPKSEVYGVFRAFKELRHRIWGVHFRLDHDALSLAKMLRELDDVPNAPLLRWVAWIRLFDFEPHHVRAETFKMEDALSRRPPAPTDTNYDDQDPEEFLDAYLDLVYSGSHNAPQGATATSAVKFLFDSVYTRLSSPFISSFSPPNSILPMYRLSKAFHDEPDFELGDFSDGPLDYSLPNSYLAVSSLRYVRPDNVRPLPEFFLRKTQSGTTSEFLLGDEYVCLEFLETGTYIQSIPLDEISVTFTGHSHGKRDKETPEMWEELRKFLSDGNFPTRLLLDRDKLQFSKRDLLVVRNSRKRFCSYSLRYTTVLLLFPQRTIQKATHQLNGVTSQSSTRFISALGTPKQTGPSTYTPYYSQFVSLSVGLRGFRHTTCYTVCIRFSRSICLKSLGKL
jgi:hypothetical protein